MLRGGDAAPADSAGVGGGRTPPPQSGRAIVFLPESAVVQPVTADTLPESAVVQPVTADTLPVASVAKSPVTQPSLNVRHLEVQPYTGEEEVNDGTVVPLRGQVPQQWMTYGTVLCRDVIAGKRCRHEDKCKFAHSIEARDEKRRAMNLDFKK